jgi:stage V sporulation protein B
VWVFLSWPIDHERDLSDSNAAGPELLTLLGVASFFVCFALMQNAILQAHGNELFTVVSMVVGGVVKVAVNWGLVANPVINITGAPIGTLSCYAVICVMNYIFLSRCLTKRPRIGRILFRPLLRAAVMGAGAWAVYGLAARFLSGGAEPSLWTIRLALVAAVGVGVLLYLVMVVLTRAVTREDMLLIPKGEKLARILHIR